MVVVAEQGAEEDLEEVEEEVVVVVTALAAVAGGGGGGWWASARGKRARESYGYSGRSTRSSGDRVHGSAGARRAWEGCGGCARI